MVKIRLRRIGARKRPIYRVVVADVRSPRDGRFLETVGHYNPLTEPATVTFNEEKLAKWISNGAQPTEVVTKLMQRAGMEHLSRRFQRAAHAGVPVEAQAATTAPAPATVVTEQLPVESAAAGESQA